MMEEFKGEINIKGETIESYSKDIDQKTLIVTKSTPVEQKYAIGHINNMIANFQSELDYWTDLKTKYDEVK